MAYSEQLTVIGVLIVLLLVILVVGCVYGFKFWKKENFENGCVKEANYDDPNFRNERFFHYDNTDQLIASDPVHVTRDVLENALMTGEDMSGYFGDVKKKTQ